MKGVCAKCERPITTMRVRTKVTIQPNTNEAEDPIKKTTDYCSYRCAGIGLIGGPAGEVWDPI